MTAKRKYFFGIDQTGAVLKTGRAKPLPCCLIEGKSIHFFYLNFFDFRQIKSEFPNITEEKSQFCVDCVFGLPVELPFDFRKVLNKTNAFKGYGRKPASEFFHSLGNGQVHRRKIEILCHANSVFQDKPFQKNIQTGTFRIWKDLASGSDWFYFPAIEGSQYTEGAPLYEGYPSLSWRRLFQVRKRSPKELTRLLKKAGYQVNWTRKHQEQVNKDSNLADAFVLALTIKLFYNETLHIVPNPEGFILGYKNS